MKYFYFIFIFNLRYIEKVIYTYIINNIHWTLVSVLTLVIIINTILLFTNHKIIKYKHLFYYYDV